MINPNWSPWIERAIVKHFRTNITASPPYEDLKVFSEKERRNTDNLKRWIVVRLDIDYNHLNREHYRVVVNCDLLVVSTKTNDIYSHPKLCGKAASVYSTIPVLDDTAPSPVQIGCLLPQGQIKETYYDIDDKLHQTTLESVFETNLEG